MSEGGSSRTGGVFPIFALTKLNRLLTNSYAFEGAYSGKVAASNSLATLQNLALFLAQFQPSHKKTGRWYLGYPLSEIPASL
jgi:predicted nucleotidyltransferase